ncbi:MAG TPA: Dyp-type peroxidase [Acidimicrobiia bacterium]|nr:Dyp-type peroxidase [Acidimicrobiia bacterium]
MAQTALTTPPGRKAEPLELADMQGLVARAYGHLPFARYIIGRFGDPAAARAWLAGIARDVCTADQPEDDGPSLNIAFSWDGLRRLGLADDALASFPRPLQEGMVTPHRSRILGDHGASDPSRWRFGRPDSNGAGTGVDVVLILYALTEEALEAEHAARRGAYGPAGALLEIADPIDGRLLDGREHFGFADGLSQPIITGWPSRRASIRPPAPPVPGRFAEVAPGEILLGYRDNFGKPAAGPTVPDTAAARHLAAAPWARGRRDLGRNGSFLVFRQLAQDVAGFRHHLEIAAIAAGARGTEVDPDRLAAKMVGRWKSGAALVSSPDADPGTVETGDFGYHDEDPEGLRCPLGAHIRRANPRDGSHDDPDRTLRSTKNHRILRRGRPYGPPLADGADPGPADPERGLVFICLNTDIERQFEFVQHTWINNPAFAGLDGEVDPAVGAQPDGGGRFTVPQGPVRHTMEGLPRFVTTRGGAYLFLPSVRALTYLASLPAG